MLKGKTPLLISLVLGLAAGLIAAVSYSKLETDIRADWSLVEVVVAAQNIEGGTEITPDLVVMRKIPDRFVTTSVVQPKDTAFMYGQRVLVPLQRGDPLLWTQFESNKASERLSNKVLKKTRAVTIEVGRVNSVGGWVRPNDHVDVVGSFVDPRTNENVAVTVLQNVTVLATGKITGTTNPSAIPESQREFTDVTLLVFPEEAEMLVLAGEMGTLTLSLRHEQDPTELDERAFTRPDSLLSGERIKAMHERRLKAVKDLKEPRSQALENP